MEQKQHYLYHLIQTKTQTNSSLNMSFILMPFKTGSKAMGTPMDITSMTLQ